MNFVCIGAVVCCGDPDLYSETFTLEQLPPEVATWGASARVSEVFILESGRHEEHAQAYVCVGEPATEEISK